MKLESFSVENFRSITTARKIPLSEYSLLIGANNEGKSNLLHALRVAMNVLVNWRHVVKTNRGGRTIRATSPYILSRRAGYDWAQDFPIAKQKRSAKNKCTKITLEFSLTPEEIEEFSAEIGSRLNGALPIVVSFSPEGAELSVSKPGHGGATLNKKSNKIANFISKRISFEYIPAIRTADKASSVISELLDRELAALEFDEEYSAALDKIQSIQDPIFKNLGDAIQKTVVGFLPTVSSVKIEPKREEQHRALRREINITVNDGQSTRLERKGDGVQSIVALAVMRFFSSRKESIGNNIIAIEEPESHLHPFAIHELRKVILEMADNNQIVLTSHSPLFVNPSKLENTVIVQGSRAKAAEHVGQIRDVLGVKFSDNLYNASVIGLVEGFDDVVALQKIMAARSKKIDAAFKSGTLILDHLSGASSLSQKASYYTASACQIQCLLDNDSAGVEAVNKALASKVIQNKDYNLTSTPGLPESELEDLYNIREYKSDFFDEFGVDIGKSAPGPKKLKWSDRTKRIFESSGKVWTKDIKDDTKHWLARFAAANPNKIIREETAQSLENFIKSIEKKLPS